MLLEDISSINSNEFIYLHHFSSDRVDKGFNYGYEGLSIFFRQTYHRKQYLNSWIYPRLRRDRTIQTNNFKLFLWSSPLPIYFFLSFFKVFCFYIPIFYLNFIFYINLYVKHIMFRLSFYIFIQLLWYTFYNNYYIYIYNYSMLLLYDIIIWHYRINPYFINNVFVFDILTIIIMLQ